MHLILFFIVCFSIEEREMNFWLLCIILINNNNFWSIFIVGTWVIVINWWLLFKAIDSKNKHDLHFLQNNQCIINSNKNYKLLKFSFTPKHYHFCMTFNYWIFAFTNKHKRLDKENNLNIYKIIFTHLQMPIFSQVLLTFDDDIWN